MGCISFTPDFNHRLSYNSHMLIYLQYQFIEKGISTFPFRSATLSRQGRQLRRDVKMLFEQHSPRLHGIMCTYMSFLLQSQIKDGDFANTPCRDL